VEKNDIQTRNSPAASSPSSKLTEEQEREEHEEKKQKSELAVASRLIQHIDWTGKVLDFGCLVLPEVFVLSATPGRRRLSVSGERKPASTPGRSALALCSTSISKTSRRGGLAIT